MRGQSTLLLHCCTSYCTAPRVNVMATRTVRVVGTIESSGRGSKLTMLLHTLNSRTHWCICNSSLVSSNQALLLLLLLHSVCSTSIKCMHLRVELFTSSNRRMRLQLQQAALLVAPVM